jgi:dephospho-CoA kinase
MFCLAITGGIGSGKSYVVRLMEAFGFPAYIADIMAKGLYKSDNNLMNTLVNLLGPEIVVNGELQKEVMASKIFRDKEILLEVNKIVHPLVMKDFLSWRESKNSEGFNTILFESAIFFETPEFHDIADKVIVVVAPESVRISRVMKRDSISEQLVRERIAKQWSDEDRIKMADFIIFADGKRAIMPQIIKIFEATGIVIN